MTFANSLESEQLALALEITPPRASRPKVLLRRAGLLGNDVQAVNVIQRGDRQSSLEASIELMAAGHEPVWHLTTRGRTTAEIATQLETAAASGVRNVLCIRGDGGDARDGGPTIKATVAQVRDALPRALVGATFNQYGPTPERAIANLAGKLEAGARYIQTQAVYDVGALERLVSSQEIEEHHPFVVAMVMPLLTVETVAAVEGRLGISVPSAYRGRVAEGPEQGWHAFAEIVERSVASRHIDGLAIMTFEADSGTDTAARLLSALRSAGAIT